MGQPAGEEQTGARTDGGDGGDGDQESGGCEDEQEGGENKEREREREDANNRRNRSSTGKRRPPAKNIVAVSPKKGICLDNPYPYLDNIQTPAVAPPPPRVLFGRTPSPPLAVGIRSQSLESHRDIEQTRAPHRQPGEHQGRGGPAQTTMTPELCRGRAKRSRRREGSAWGSPAAISFKSDFSLDCTSIMRRAELMAENKPA